MTNYELKEDLSGNNYVIMTTKEGIISFVPTDPANSDYQLYLAWLENPEAEQSTPSITE
jgi:hypothetical protein